MLLSYTFEIEEETKNKLEKLAEEEHRSLAGQIRVILETYLEMKKYE